VPDGVVSSCAWRLAGETAYALEGFVPNAGGVTTWLRQIGALAPDAFPVITDSAAGASPADDAAETGRGSGGAGGADGLWCVPALFGLGTPHWTAAAAADVTGLTPASTSADLAQAAMLGVVHQIADAIDAVRPGLPGPLRLVRADGGLAGNDSVLQAIADLAGISLERPAVTEATALGAGALAGLGTGLWDRAGLAAMAFEVGPAVQPALPPSRRAEARYGWSCALAGAMSRWQQTAQEAGR